MTPRDVVYLRFYPYSAHPYLTEFDLLALGPTASAVEDVENDHFVVHQFWPYRYGFRYPGTDR